MPVMFENDPKNKERLAKWKLGDPMINERDFWQDENYVAPDKEKEKMVLKLAMMITDRYIKRYTRTVNNRDPEYWALDRILTKDEVRFLLNFKKTRVPYTVSQLAKMNGMSFEDTKKMIERLSWIGMIEMTRRKKPPHVKMWNLPIFVPGSAEFMVMTEFVGSIIPPFFPGMPELIRRQWGRVFMTWRNGICYGHYRGQSDGFICPGVSSVLRVYVFLHRRAVREA